jgi:alpha-galactosidase
VTCSIRRFSDYPAVEWMLTFKNTGKKDTPILENVEALRLGLTRSGQAGSYTVYGANGGRPIADNMTPIRWQSSPDQYSDTFEFTANRSSNAFLPFWNVETPDNRGVAVAFGWTGVWSAEMKISGSDMAMTAGMNKEHLSLHPGEEVRSPRVLLVFWEGQHTHGSNMLRQVLYKHYLHSNKGKAGQEPIVSVNFCFTHHSNGGYLTDATEQTLKPLVQPFLDIGAEAFVVDAGWYECKEWTDIEKDCSYTISKQRWPNGFKPISEPLKTSKIPFGLWFAPEVGRDLGKPGDREQFLGIVDNMVKNEGITYYRQDDGTIWDESDPNRLGIDQIRRIEGLYTVWDEIIKHHPGILMEGCSSGGRRIDLETIQRFSWIQKSDRWFDANSDQCGVYGACQFLPGGLLNVPTNTTEDYGAWSSFGGQLCLGWQPTDPDFPMEQAKLQVERYKRIRPLLSGDFYPLTSCGRYEPWMAYQFHRVDLDKGFALIFRRDKARESKLTVGLKGLNPETMYKVHFESADKDAVLSGKELAALEIVIDEAPGAEMVRYEGKGGE